MQVPQTESPSEFTTSAVLTAYKALPESLRPFYAHIHCGSAAIVAALGLTAEDNNVLETAVKAIGDLADDAEAFDRDAAAESGTLADMIRELATTAIRSSSRSTSSGARFPPRPSSPARIPTTMRIPSSTISTTTATSRGSWAPTGTFRGFSRSCSANSA